MNKNIENVIELTYANGQSIYTTVDNVKIDMDNGYIAILRILDINKVKYLYKVKDIDIKTQLQQKNLVSITKYIPVKHDSYNTIAVPLPINYVAMDPEDETESINVCQSYVLDHDKMTIFFDTYTMSSSISYENNKCKYYLNVYMMENFHVCYKKNMCSDKYVIQEAKNDTDEI